MIKRKNIEYFSILLYLTAISAFQLGEGVDALLVRSSFALMIFICIFWKNRVKLILTEHLKWCCLFWGLYYSSVIWASNVLDVLYYINNTIQILGISICFSCIINDENDIERIMKLVVFALIITSIRLVILTPGSAWGTERIGEVIGQNSNGLGMSLSIGSIICLYFLHQILNKFDDKKRIKILFYISASIIFSGIALFTGSKKSIIILLLGMSVYELLITKGWKFIIKIIGTTTFIIGIYHLIFNNEMLYMVLGRRIERTIFTLQGTASGFSVDGSLEERSFYIRMAQELFFNYPILGYGGNNFVTYMREIGYSHVAYCHNNYFEILSTLGIIGFIIYYSEWFFVLLRLIKAYRLQKEGINLLFVILIGIELIMDYGNVSYINIFTNIIFILGFFMIRMNKNIGLKITRREENE